MKSKNKKTYSFTLTEEQINYIDLFVEKAQVSRSSALGMILIEHEALRKVFNNDRTIIK